MKNKKEKIKVDDEKNNINEEETLKKGFFKKVWYAITKFEKYPDLAAEGFFKAIKYLLTIMVIYALISSTVMTYRTATYTNQVVSYVINELPNFEYSDNILKIDAQEPIIEEKSDLGLGLVIIDTSINSENEEQIEEYEWQISKEITENGTIFMQDKILIKEGENQVEYTYSEFLQLLGLEETEFSKADIETNFTGTQAVNVYAMYFLSMFIYVYVVYTASVLVDTITLAVVGFITAMAAKLKMKLVAIYNMSVYSLTLSIIFSIIYAIVNFFTGFEIVYFQVMYIAIAYIYLAAAIFMIKSDFVKKQAELQKINEEEEKIREELIRKEEQKQKKENKEQKEDKKQNKEKQKKSKKENKKDKEKKQESDNNLKDAPGQSNA